MSAEEMASKEGRELCWLQRDKYWKCMEEKDEKACVEERKNFEKDCSKTWVKIFK